MFRLNSLNIKLILSIFLFSFSCAKNNQDNPKVEVQSQIKKETAEDNPWVGEPMLLPKSEKEITIKNTDLVENKSKFMIIVYYDGSCSICYLHLKRWISTMKFFTKYDVSYTFIVSNANETVIEGNIEEIEFPLSLVSFDVLGEYGKKYDFFLKPNYVNSSVLLDKKGTILSIGNPSISEDDKNKFIELMDDL